MSHSRRHIPAYPDGPAEASCCRRRQPKPQALTALSPAQLVEEPVDTTAAGDLWAAGFLYGVLRERPLMEAAWYGSLISSEVVKVVGSELPEPAWNEIKGKIAK